MRADKPSEKNAKNSILIADAEESVNMLSAPFRMLFVNGTAAEAADSNKYATICKFGTLPQSNMFLQLKLF